MFSQKEARRDCEFGFMVVQIYLSFLQIVAQLYRVFVLYCYLCPPK